MSSQNLSIPKTISALRLSIADGLFAQIYVNLTGSVFLPAFALALNATPVQVGMLAAIPFFANTSQFLGSYLVERFQRRKLLTTGFSFVSRCMWIPVVLLSFWKGDSSPQFALYGLLVLVLTSAILASFSGIAWLSWMAGLVPADIRGRFFGLRNSLLGVVTVSVTLAGSRFLDVLPNWFPGISQLRAFEILFSFAVVAGMISSYLLTKKPELPTNFSVNTQFKKIYRAPLKNPDFRRLIEFSMIRSFATNIAAPFFIVYMLEDLQLSYSTIGIFTILTSLADLVGMWIWGHLSDQIGNKPVIVLVTIVTTFLPVCWLLTGPNDLTVFLLIPIFNLTGGFMWAGYNLCTVNLLFRMVPEEGNSAYFAFWSVLNGFCAGIGALVGGVMAKNFDLLMALMPFSVDFGYKLLFLISAMVRIIPLFLVFKIRENYGMPFVKAISVLRNVKSWGSLMGFNAPLHFFLPNRSDQDQPSPYWPLWRNPAARSRH